MAKLEAASDVDLYVGSSAISRDELLRRVKGVDAIVCLLTEAIDAAVLDAAGPQLRIVANVAVGYNNVSNFNRQFLALKGMPPSRFRALLAENTRAAEAA